MITTEIKEAYIASLAEELSEQCHLSRRTAISIVRGSAVCNMLEDEEDAVWQLHQPLDAAVKQIVAEYQRKYTAAQDAPTK